MSNVIAGVIRGQYDYLEEHIAQKKVIYDRYAEGLKDLPIEMNPIVEGCEPNYWLSALTLKEDLYGSRCIYNQCIECMSASEEPAL